ncbi:hypothetical protein K440DRAFT_681880 [Wilcoxina mikolae CBS 423.85]|nr:hypothetical protein K440DRAFT_681880 [Wilcoxina mikolae CBS 423.85]
MFNSLVAWGIFLNGLAAAQSTTDGYYPSGTGQIPGAAVIYNSEGIPTSFSSATTSVGTALHPAVVTTISGTEVYEQFPTAVASAGTTFTPIPIQPDSTGQSSSAVESSSAAILNRRQVAVGTGGVREFAVTGYGTDVVYEAFPTGVYYPNNIVVGTAVVYRDIIGAATTGSSTYPLPSGYAQNSLYHPQYLGSIAAGVSPPVATAVAIGETFGTDRIYRRAVGTGGVYNEFIGYKAAVTGTPGGSVGTATGGYLPTAGTVVASTGGYFPTAGATSAGIYRRQEATTTTTSSSTVAVISTPVASASVTDVILLPESGSSTIPNPTPPSATATSTVVASATDIAVLSVSPIPSSTLAPYPTPSATSGVSSPVSGIVGTGGAVVYPTSALPSDSEPIVPANSGAEATVGRRSAVATFALVVCGIMAMLA